MQTDEFLVYCENIEVLIKSYPDWMNMPDSLIGDFMNSTAYGFGRVLHDLLKGAAAIVSQNVSNQQDIDLFELAGALYAKSQNSSDANTYRINSYYFAVCVFAVASGVVPVGKIDVDVFDENELMYFNSTVSYENIRDPLEKKLSRYTVRLFDFSRSNQLVHCRPSGSRMLKLVAYSIRKVTDALARNERVEICSWAKINVKTVYRCKICGGVSFEKYDIGNKVQPAEKCAVCDAENTHNRKSRIPLKEKLTVLGGNRYTCPDCNRQMTVDDLYKNQFVCPKCKKSVPTDYFPIIDTDSLSHLKDWEVLSEVGDVGTKEKCKAILGRANTLNRNFGLHVLYLAYGFLHWKDANHTEYTSPLLLLPVNLSLDRATGTYFIESDESNCGFEVNKTLIQMLKSYSQDCSIDLPALKGEAPELYFSSVSSSFRSRGDVISNITQDWSIEHSMGIGLFHYQKLQLEYDITENMSRYLEHPVIRRMCGDTACSFSYATSDGKSKKYMLMDADSSQEEIIDAALDNRSFVLQGPPGSGKSQTITNIIATAIGGGKTVLFVTQKASARSIIIDNLNSCSLSGNRKLSDFVLDFDSFNKRGGAIGRDPFVKHLNEVAAHSAASPFRFNDEADLADDAFLKDKIRQFMQTLCDEHDGRRLLDVLQGLAQFVEQPILDCSASVPHDRALLGELTDVVSRYYIAFEKGDMEFDYRRDRLFGCKGDSGGQLFAASENYLHVSANISAAFDTLETYGWDRDELMRKPAECVSQLAKWTSFPLLNREILNGLDLKKLDKLLAYSRRRRKELETIEKHDGVIIEKSVNARVFDTFDIGDVREKLNGYSVFFKRCGKRYKDLLGKIFATCSDTVGKRNYQTAVRILCRLSTYRDYLQLKSEYDNQTDADVCKIGLAPSTFKEWTALIDGLETARQLIASDASSCILSNEWFLLFEKIGYTEHVEWIKQTVDSLSALLADEVGLSKQIRDFFVNASRPKFLSSVDCATLVCEEKKRLGSWEQLYKLLQRADANGLLPVIHELIDKGIRSEDDAKAAIMKTFYGNEVRRFEDENGTDLVGGFNRSLHEKLLSDYAVSDQTVISHAADRLYSDLAAKLLERNDALVAEGKSTKISSKTHWTIKQTIKEYFPLIKIIKPCFMMSPLNVSQYIDIDTSFDLVIFDEASQIFVEDALASIVRGKQVIIAGDSKQLPPCDFFRAGDVLQDDDDVYFEEEKTKSDSLLDSADEALTDQAVSLAWHYRSCDESLIDFSNKYMNYGLISFPSAVRNPNDGIVYHQVPYSPKTCYVSGKNGSHENVGEAEAIVELIWKEMNHPDRAEFSIGVVAFSNAQALAIEARWEEYKERPDKKDYIAAWEKRHEDKPIVFCNLDTMQGDERDTMLISICYSKDAKGKFSLPYLGRIRLTSGKKRINVAITRARHRMIVVSTLGYATLNAAIAASSAPEENKAGAVMLAEFLKYAESFSTDNSVVKAPTINKFAQSVCRVLDEEGILYDTEIGRSDCKINVGIRKACDDKSFVLGIIIDDPSRKDFDSPREYARLTEQILTGKYNWSIYRVFPISWVYDYENERKKLLHAIKDALE